MRKRENSARGSGGRASGHLASGLALAGVGKHLAVMQPVAQPPSEHAALLQSLKNFHPLNLLL
jgi:hypothetical protein